MLKIDRINCQLSKLEPLLMADADMQERAHLQQLVFRNTGQFFQKECGENLFVLNEEVKPSDLVGDRIDLLAVDSDGATVIIELKRGSDKLQLLQALSYAAMLSDLTWNEVKAKARVCQDRLSALGDSLAENSLEESSEADQLTLNHSQRILLIAESYNYEVLCTAQWLTDKWGLNITCYEVALARDEATSSEYLSAVQILPAKPLAEQARLRGSFRGQVFNEPKLVEKRLAECENEAVLQFFEEALQTNPRRNKRGSAVIFPLLGKMRYRVFPRKELARVTQLGRFDRDQEQWAGLSSSVNAVQGGQNLVFNLKTTSDTKLFRSFLDEKLPQVKWYAATLSSNEDEDEIE